MKYLCLSTAETRKVFPKSVLNVSASAGWLRKSVLWNKKNNTTMSSCLVWWSNFQLSQSINQSIHPSINQASSFFLPVAHGTSLLVALAPILWGCTKKPKHKRGLPLVYLFIYFYPCCPNGQKDRSKHPGQGYVNNFFQCPCQVTHS